MKAWTKALHSLIPYSAHYTLIRQGCKPALPALAPAPYSSSSCQPISWEEKDLVIVFLDSLPKPTSHRLLTDFVNCFLWGAVSLWGSPLVRCQGRIQTSATDANASVRFDGDAYTHMHTLLHWSFSKVFNIIMIILVKNVYFPCLA